MSGSITWETLFSLITLIGVVIGIWRYVSGAIGKVDRDLQEYKLKVAETYASKEGVNQQFDAVSKTITGVGERMEKRLDGMNERLDRVIEAGKPAPRGAE